MDSLEDQFGSLRTEWNVVKEKWFTGEALDPVFEGMVKDFCVFDYTMQDMYKKVEGFMKSVDTLAEGLVTLSEAAIAGLAHVDDTLIKSDSCQMREATNQITRGDAPHSAIAKLRRDMDFNIMHPIRNHLINNRNLKAHLEKRRRRLFEFNAAKKAHDDCVKKGLRNTDRRFLSTQAGLESSKMAFHEVDKHIFEWLYILEEYKGDILDSTLQTLKYLQYEFFSTSAHAISSVLPARMEFRPMVEMTPEHLEAQVELELQDADDDEEAEVVTDFSVRLIEKLAKDNKTKPGEGLDSAGSKNGPALPVDPLSLSSLLSQGFEEGPARQALRKHRNDTQAALDYLINGGEEEKEEQDNVRMPTTVKRVQRLKARRRAQQEKARDANARADEAKAVDARAFEAKAEAKAEAKTEAKTAATAEANAEAKAEEPRRPPPPQQDLLGFDQEPGAASQAPKKQSEDLLGFDAEPPPPTDFSKDVVRMPLPPTISFDASKCEKAPLPASVAAGTSVPRSGLAPEPSAALAGVPQDQAALVQALVASSQITPEQLIRAAQQLQAQQQAQGLSSPFAQASQPVGPAQLASLYQASLAPTGDGGYPVMAGQQETGNGSSFSALDPLAMFK